MWWKEKSCIQKGKNVRSKSGCIIERFTLTTTKHAGEYAMVCGCFVNHKVGYIEKIEGIMKKESCHQILITNYKTLEKD